MVSFGPGVNGPTLTRVWFSSVAYSKRVGMVRYGPQRFWFQTAPIHSFHPVLDIGSYFKFFKPNTRPAAPH
jgi:hypothetical protein